MLSTKTAADTIRGLRQELGELEETLLQLGARKMDEGVAVLYRYTTARICEIAMQWYELTRQSLPRLAAV